MGSSSSADVNAPSTERREEIGNATPVGQNAVGNRANAVDGNARNPYPRSPRCRIGSRPREEVGRTHK